MLTTPFNANTDVTDEKTAAVRKRAFMDFCCGQATQTNAPAGIGLFGAQGVWILAAMMTNPPRERYTIYVQLMELRQRV